MAALKLVRQMPKAARQTKAPVDPLVAAKKKFLEGVGHQIALAKNPKYTIEKVTYKGGKRQVKKAPPRQWWREIAGEVYIPIRYGNKPLQLKGGTNIAVCQPKELVATLQAIQENGASGEWDDAILRSATRARKAAKVGKAKKAAAKKPRRKAKG
jgi:hypothetical protein